ncbi:SHOCT domain-containing protein [Peptostreptococcus equinus]|uniref:SHOCT domain-containing protein n=1 Tax=Peptostreptococcus equinus TaxID=3003601 RepID=A0ABY7JS98_9FIRM|nr:SHOCT domain-containing protein [Peptostreptococcus sp. CBA3647]WAW14572.1 SHOCT domain-containing protein [Peptostreptococcus sp. CBA3647]
MSKLNENELRKLKGLLDDGIITQEEFNRKKEDLLRENSSTSSIYSINYKPISFSSDSAKKKIPNNFGIIKIGCLGFIAIVIVLILVNTLKPYNQTTSVTTVTDSNIHSNNDDKNSIPEDFKKVIDGTIMSGHYQVGKDMKAGEYKIFAENENAYMEITKDIKGKSDSIIYNYLPKTFSYIFAKDGQYVKLDNCYAVPASKAKKFDGKEYKDGQYKVGFDIPAGEYNITANNENAYFEVSTSPSDNNTIVNNDCFTDNRMATIKDGQYFKLQDATAIKR